MDQPHTSIPGLIMQRAALHAGKAIFRIKHRGIWKTVTWHQLAQQVQQIGSALLAAGFARGDVVAIVSEARPEAVYADLAIHGCGAASVAIDPDDDADRVCHLMSSSGSRLAFVENEEKLDKVLSVRDRCLGLSRIVVFDMKGLRDFQDASCVGLSQFMDTAAAAADWAASVRSIAPDQPAVIHFVRGKAAGMGHMLTHGDLMHLVSLNRSRLLVRPNDERMAVLRLTDITERVWGLYLALQTGCVSNYPEGPDTVIENLRELEPTILGADSVMWDALYTQVSARVNAATPAQRFAYEWAIAAGRVGGTKARLADLLVLKAVRREFGLNRLRLAYLGGGSLAPAVVDWARCLGIAFHRVHGFDAGAGQADERYAALLQNVYA